MEIFFWSIIIGICTLAAITLVYIFWDAILGRKPTSFYAPFEVDFKRTPPVLSSSNSERLSSQIPKPPVKTKPIERQSSPRTQVAKKENDSILDGIQAAALATLLPPFIGSESSNTGGSSYDTGSSSFGEGDFGGGGSSDNY